jgi:hypothetical protein
MGAGLTKHDDGDGYLVDLLSTSAMPSEHQLQNLRAMNWQAQKIRLAFRASDQWVALKHEFPELRKVEEAIVKQTGEGSSKSRRPLLRLYARYISEWDKFSALCPALSHSIARVA